LWLVDGLSLTEDLHKHQNNKHNVPYADKYPKVAKIPQKFTEFITHSRLAGLFGPKIKVGLFLRSVGTRDNIHKKSAVGNELQHY
jgi:hypothetical protein